MHLHGGMGRILIAKLLDRIDRRGSTPPEMSEVTASAPVTTRHDQHSN